MKRTGAILVIIAALAVTAWWTTAALAWAGPQPAALGQAAAAGYAAVMLAVLPLVRPLPRARAT